MEAIVTYRKLGMEAVLLADRVETNFFGRWKYRITHATSVIKGVQTVGAGLAGIIRAVDTLVSTFIDSVAFAKDVEKDFEPFFKQMRKAKVFSILMAPISLYNIGKHSWIAHKYGRMGDDEGVEDHGLEIVSHLSTLIDNIATFVSGLEFWGLVGSSVEAWTTPLFGIGAALSSVTVVIHTRAFHLRHKFERKLKSDSLHEIFQNRREVQRRFGVDRKTFYKLKGRIEKSEDQKPIYKKLMDRIKFKKRSDCLAIVAAAVAIIGTAILLACPAVEVVAFALLVVSGVVTIAKGVYDFRNERLLKEYLKENTANHSKLNKIE